MWQVEDGGWNGQHDGAADFSQVGGVHEVPPEKLYLNIISMEWDGKCRVMFPRRPLTPSRGPGG
jgi:hypothetical protein